MPSLDELIANPAELMNPAHNDFLLANKSWQEVEAYLKKDTRIILPIGSTEQHGPDGITGVDHITATGIAYGLAQLSNVLCAPPLNYGMAVHHLGFSGTMALRPTTYINLIIDLLTSLKRHGFRKIIVVNGHGGNKGPFVNALQEKLDEFKDLEIRFVNWWVMPGLQKNIIDKYFKEKEGYHATPTELSLTMSLIPGAMTMPESYECPQQEVSSSNYSWVMPAKFRELYPDGVMRADYSGSTAEIGKEALKYSLTEILEIIDELK